MSSQTRNVCIPFEDGIEKFLDLLWEEEHNKKEGTCSVDEEPPVTQCVRLDMIEAYSISDIGLSRVFKKRTVRRRINFDDPEDKERLIKKAKLRELMLLRRSRLLILEERKRGVAVMSRKRKRDEDGKTEGTRKRMRYF